MRKKRVLIVDDELKFTRLLKLNLEELGEYEVRIENNAPWAVEAMHEFEPDLIILDMVMPHMSGHDVAIQMKSEMTQQQIPILFLSAAVKWEERGQSTDTVHEIPVIPKPISATELVRHIEQTLCAV
jgi:CheY-like chemotaxis protein